MSGGNLPTHRLLLVRDKAGAEKGEEGVFMELGPLWPSKSGFSGPIKDFPVSLILTAGGKYRFIVAEIKREAPPSEEPPEGYEGQFDDPT